MRQQCMKPKRQNGGLRRHLCYILIMHTSIAYFFGYFWHLQRPGGRES